MAMIVDMMSFIIYHPQLPQLNTVRKKVNHLLVSTSPPLPDEQKLTPLPHICSLLCKESKHVLASRRKVARGKP
jgi:hypothetical protein